MSTKEKVLKKQIRARLFAGEVFSDQAKKIIINKNRAIANVDKLIVEAEQDFIPLAVKVEMLTIKEFYSCVYGDKRNVGVKGLFEESSDFYHKFSQDDISAFRTLYDAITLKHRPDTELLRKNISDLNNKAKRLNSNTSVQEAIRKFTNLCESLLVKERLNKSLYFLTDDFSKVVDHVNKIDKIGFNIVEYVGLAEASYDLLEYSDIPEHDKFPLILALIGLKCDELKIAVPRNSQIVQCPSCGDEDQSGNICSKCGAYINCPGCNTPIKKGAKNCNGCGVETSEIGSYVSQLEGVERNIARNKIQKAEEILLKLAGIWGKNERVAIAQKKIQELKSQLSEQEKAIEQLILKNRFLEAQCLLSKVNVNASPALEQKERLIQQKLLSAKTFVEAANSQTATEKKIDAYCSALQVVSDYWDALNGLKANPPKAPASLQVVVKGRTVLLNWSKFASGNVSYILIRKVNGRPSGPTDGEIIAETKSNQFDDANTIAGVSYYYAVYSKCFDIFSESAAQSAPVLTLEEIAQHQISFDVKETNIRFTCKFPTNAKGIELYRDNSLLVALANENYNDSNLRTDKQYSYKFVAVFEDCLGKKYRTNGVSLSLQPTAPPKAISNFECKLENKNVSLSWRRPEKGEAYVLQSNKPAGLDSGMTVSIEKLKNLGHPITLLSQSSAKKSLTNSGTVYFSIWTIFGQSAIFGKEIEVSNIDSVTNVKAILSMGKLFVEWEWPQGIETTLLSYSNKSFDDPKAAQIRITKENYEREGAYVIRNVRDGDYYFSISSCHTRNKRELISESKRVFFSNSKPIDLEYFVKYRKLFGKKLELKILSKENKVLPGLVLVAKDGGVPIKKEDGIEILELTGVSTNSSHKISLDEITIDRYVRLFVKESGASNLRILTPPKEKLKLF